MENQEKENQEKQPPKIKVYPNGMLAELQPSGKYKIVTGPKKRLQGIETQEKFTDKLKNIYFK